MYVNCNIGARSRNHCYRGKEISITYSECAYVALAIQHAKIMRRITLLSVACSALQYFSTLRHNRHHSRKTLSNIKRVFLFSLRLLPETFLIPSRIYRDIINVHRSSCKVHKMHMTVKHAYLFTNYTHSDMFRLERVIIRLSIEQYIRYIKC